MQRRPWQRFVFEGLPVVLAFEAAGFLVPSGSGIHDLQPEWRHLLVWLIVFLALSRFMRSLVQLFVPNTKSPRHSDLYTSAKAEIAAEHTPTNPQKENQSLAGNW